jgi:hypothetical protein
VIALYVGKGEREGSRVLSSRHTDQNLHPEPPIRLSDTTVSPNNSSGVLVIYMLVREGIRRL